MIGGLPDGRGGPHAYVEDLDDPVLSAEDRHHLSRVLRLRDGDALTVVAVTAASQGDTEIVGGQLLRYTPADGFVGEDFFAYVVDDGQGARDAGLVTVTVLPEPEPVPVEPVPVPEPWPVPEPVPVPPSSPSSPSQSSSRPLASRSSMVFPK